MRARLHGHSYQQLQQLHAFCLEAADLCCLWCVLRPSSISTQSEHVVSNPAQAAPSQAPSAAGPAQLQFKIKPTPARKTGTTKPVAVVKPEPVEEQQQLLLQEEADAAAFDSDSTEPSSLNGKRLSLIHI